LLIFIALTVAVGLGMAYVAVFFSGEEDLGRRRLGASGRSAHGDGDEEEMTLREELGNFAREANVYVAKRARALIVGVQRFTHRDEAGASDASWRRLSDTNPFVRWVKRQIADGESDDEGYGLGESLIDEGDEDYDDMMSEPYRFSEFTDYLAQSGSAAARTSLEDAEDASFVRLPKPRKIDSSWLGGDVGGDDNDVL